MVNLGVVYYWVYYITCFFLNLPSFTSLLAHSLHPSENLSRSPQPHLRGRREVAPFQKRPLWEVTLFALRGDKEIPGDGKQKLVGSLGLVASM